MSDDSIASNNARNNAHWMPFTPMREYQKNPMSFVAADGMYYVTDRGRRVLDAMGGLWCVNAGHGVKKISAAICDMAEKLDFVSSFRMDHPAAAQMARALTDKAPADLNHAFFVNSGSEAVDTALKIARAFHQKRGDTRRTRFIGRAKGYHGMGFGGLSIAGIAKHKRDFGPLLGDVAHLPLPYDRSMAFSKGQPEQGAYYAESLEQLVAIYGGETIAAVVIEPVTGSGGVYPPPKGYLNRIREICDHHGILLIFDEVITGFGRLGYSFAAEAYGVIPDLITCAKGLTNGAVPMGAVLAKSTVYDAFLSAPDTGIELFHGYTYSAHPLACAAGLATIAVHEELELNKRVLAVAPVWEKAALELREAAHVADVRACGILAGIDLLGRPDAPGARGAACAQACFDAGFLVRNAGDTLVLSPPLIIDESQIEELFGTIRNALKTIG